MHFVVAPLLCHPLPTSIITWQKYNKFILTAASAGDLIGDVRTLRQLYFEGPNCFGFEVSWVRIARFPVGKLCSRVDCSFLEGQPELDWWYPVTRESKHGNGRRNGLKVLNMFASWTCRMFINSFICVRIYVNFYCLQFCMFYLVCLYMYILCLGDSGGPTPSKLQGRPTTLPSLDRHVILGYHPYQLSCYWWMMNWWCKAMQHLGLRCVAPLPCSYLERLLLGEKKMSRSCWKTICGGE